MTARRQRRGEAAAMNEQHVTRITIVQHRSPLLYSEQETATASHLAPGTIRHLRALGLVAGEEVDGELRYSEEEIMLLRRIRRLHYDLGINMAGVEVIIRLLQRIDELQADLERARGRE